MEFPKTLHVYWEKLLHPSGIKLYDENVNFEKFYSARCCILKLRIDGNIALKALSILLSKRIDIYFTAFGKAFSPFLNNPNISDLDPKSVATVDGQSADGQSADGQSARLVHSQRCA
jgi:hypothetical protein